MRFVLALALAVGAMTVTRGQTIDRNARHPPVASGKRRPLRGGQSVKCDMSRGEREYLNRLKCPDGKAPTFERRGSTGSGPDGHVLDVYKVACPGGQSTDVVMDMYHP